MPCTWCRCLLASPCGASSTVTAVLHPKSWHLSCLFHLAKQLLEAGTRGRFGESLPEGLEAQKPPGQTPPPGSEGGEASGASAPSAGAGLPLFPATGVSSPR